MYRRGSALAGLVGALLLSVATGVSLTVVGATNKTWYGPWGESIPTEDELPPAPPAFRVMVDTTPGGVMLSGQW